VDEIFEHWQSEISILLECFMILHCHRLTVEHNFVVT